MLLEVSIWLLLVPLCLSSICSNLTLGYYSYDLSSLNNIQSLPGYKFSLCQNTGCLEDTGYLYYSYILTLNTTSCTSLTRSQLSSMNISQTSKGLTLNYPFITKYLDATNNTNTATIRTIVEITCDTSINAVETVNVSVTGNNITTYTFSAKSSAGCPFEGDTQIWQYFRDKSIIFAIVFWIIGLYSMFLGYFLIRVTVLIYGFVTAAGFSLIFFTFGYPQQDQSASVLNWMLILSSILGIFYGFFLITLPRVGYFNIGIWFGVIISLLLQNSIFVYTKTLIPFYVCLGVISFICGIAGIMGFKYFIIVSTSLISGFLLIRPLGFYLPYYPNEFNFYKQGNKMPWQYYLYLIAIIVLFIIGIIFQSWLFKKRGRKDKLFHLQDDTDLKTKFKNLLQFKEIKDFISKGTDEFKVFKNLISSRKEDKSQQYSRESEVEEFPKKKQKDKENKGKYRPPSMSDQVSQRSESQRESAASIQMMEIKKKQPLPPQRKEIRKNR